MKLEELRDGIKKLKRDTKDSQDHIERHGYSQFYDNPQTLLKGIKQTVEAIDCITINDGINDKRYKIWQEIKLILDCEDIRIKEHGGA